MNLERTTFAKLPGWREDDSAAALSSFRRSCERVANDGEFVASGQIVVASSFLAKVCRDMPRNPTNAQAKAFFEKWFEPYLVTRPDGSFNGLVTGYYETEVEGSRTRTEQFTVPIYGPPRDLVSGARYKTRREIETHGLSQLAPVLFWARHPSEVHILHIQGSGRVRTPDGVHHRVGFAGSNNHTFRGIGSILRENNIDVGGNYCMVNVKRWLDNNVERGRAFMKQNDRFIFFREIHGDGPIGALGVPLTPMRSIAVDSEFIPLGLPLFLVTTEPSGRSINSLVVAQDVGSAIKGVIRVDLFYGFGREAFQIAGRMSNQGRYYILLPRDGKHFAVKR
jgi:membrane-bound lytic murein transglycosylase A